MSKVCSIFSNRVYLQVLGGNQGQCQYCLGGFLDPLDQQFKGSCLMPSSGIFCRVGVALAEDIVIPSGMTSYKLYVCIYKYIHICIFKVKMKQYFPMAFSNAFSITYPSFFSPPLLSCQVKSPLNFSIFSFISPVSYYLKMFLSFFCILFFKY